MSDQSILDRIFISLRDILAHAVSKIVHPKDIEDVVQETYVKICQIEKFQEIKYPRAFLLKIAKNIALDKIKSADSRLTVSMVGDELDSLNVENEFLDETYAMAATQEEFAMYCEAMRRLPTQCRRAFVLKKIYGFSQKEISGHMGISEKTVEKHIAIGIKRCCDYMNYDFNNVKKQTNNKKLQRGNRGN